MENTKWIYNTLNNSIDDHEGREKCEFKYFNGNWNDVQLMASAPELLDALKETSKMLEKCYTGEILEPYNKNNISILLDSNNNLVNKIKD